MQINPVVTSLQEPIFSLASSCELKAQGQTDQKNMGLLNEK